MSTLKSITFLTCIVFTFALTQNGGPSINQPSTTSHGKIINGSEAVQGQFKWQVGINYHEDNKNRFDGGALISNQWVLTRAYTCKYGYAFEVILGATLRTEPQEGKITRRGIKALYHPQYEASSQYNVGLLKMNTPVEFNEFIQAIGLPLATDYLEDDSVVQVSGWGWTGGLPGDSEKLNFVELNTITNEKCVEYYDKERILENVVCAQGDIIQSTCAADLGGALVQYIDNQWVHVGVASFYDDSYCSHGAPSGYVRTSMILDFIYNNID
ncbi:chymotrypsin B-like [Atheta coriaria]|uniref:chymotrypsin B-like n=1 Tax=Dalotia coriaria TaxID=877792 RepID=UPI0031F3A697